MPGKEVLDPLQRRDEGAGEVWIGRRTDDHQQGNAVSMTASRSFGL